MAKLVVKEVYEGTNEEIRELERELNDVMDSGSHKDRYGEVFQSVDYETTYDEETGMTADTPLQTHLKKELAQFRSILNEDAIARAEELIEEAATSTLTAEEVAQLEKDSQSIFNSLTSEGSDSDDSESDEPEQTVRTNRRTVTNNRRPRVYRIYSWGFWF